MNSFFHCIIETGSWFIDNNYFFGKQESADNCNSFFLSCGKLFDRRIEKFFYFEGVCKVRKVILIVGNREEMILEEYIIFYCCSFEEKMFGKYIGKYIASQCSYLTSCQGRYILSVNRIVSSDWTHETRKCLEKGTFSAPTWSIESNPFS